MLSKKIKAVGAGIIISWSLAAQNGQTDYAAEWKKVDSLIGKKGLVASAAKEADMIYMQAKKEGDEVQSIKALLYRMGLTSVNEIDALPKNIAQLEKELPDARQPARSILQNILALQYLLYFQTVRWNIYERTPTMPNFHKEDMSTWEAGDFFKKITGLFLASIKEKELLLHTSLSDISPIINQGNTRSLRPSLYDLLAHNALDYFKNNGWDDGVNAYEMGDTLAFAPAEVFVSRVFQTTDSSSLHWQALGLFQELIRFHLRDVRHDGLLDVDMERLQFVDQYGVMEDKGGLYARALGSLANQYKNDPSVSQARYLLASYYADLAAAYSPNGDTTNRYGYVQAKAICDGIVREKDSSEGQCHCPGLLQVIDKQEVRVETEKINLPGQPFRALLTWRNVPSIWYRIVRIDSLLRSPLAEYQSPYDGWIRLRNSHPLLSGSQILPETNDHQAHRVEIKINALPPGEYALLVSGHQEFDAYKTSEALQYFFVSSIAFINHEKDYFVLDRGSGKPIADAHIDVGEKSYDYQKQEYVLTHKRAYRSDEHGHFRLVQSGDLEMSISIPGDTLRSHDGLVRIESYSGEERNQGAPDSVKYEIEHLNTFFFTDRSIYRPGQTVYFKGIVMTRELATGQAKILAGFRPKVILYDANQGKLDSVLVISNEYGSYHGSFVLPEHLLNGEFTIMDESTRRTQSFSVEEYKRPRFSATFEIPKGSYRLNDTIRIDGSAQGYSGNTLDGALVKYRVSRAYRRPQYFRSSFEILEREGRKIMNGETRTDKDGHFSVAFVALPDPSINKNEDPVFTYQLSADITDQVGETHSARTTVAAGYKAMEISIDMRAAQHLPNDSFKEVMVKTTNLSGEAQESRVQTVIYRLRAPERLIRERFWSQPDQFVMNREEYLVAFPHDEYDRETKMEYWEREGKVFDSVVQGNQSIAIGKVLPAGWYVMEAASHDIYGQEVKTKSYLALYDSRSGQPGSPEYVWEFGDPAPAEPGSQVVVSIGSSETDLFVIRYLDNSTEDRNLTAKCNFVKMDRGIHRAVFLITEEDRGGYSVSDVFIKDNRIYSHRALIRVPWTNKQLNVHYTSYRDKTLPGSKESWSIKMTGSEGNKANAEILTSMFDASLDQFVHHSWFEPSIWEDHRPDQGWNSNSCFESAGSEDFSEPDTNFYRYHSACQKWYDQLFAGMMIIRNDDGSFRALIPYLDAEGLFGKPKAISVPDLMKDPDGSKGLMRDTVFVEYGMPADAPRHMKLSASGRVRVVDTISEPIVPAQRSIAEATSPIQLRKNFQETAFFLPELRTDSAGNVSFTFTMPEALTTWKWMTLAHTKDLAFGYAERSVITQKELMVQPNAPRFLREGDHMELSVKIVNLTDSEMTGQAELQLIDPTTNQSADGWFSNRQANQFFTVAARQSASVSFPIDIPFQYNRPLTYKITASARNYSDGEEATLPVLSNRMLVTESLPLNLKRNGSRSFRFDKLLQSGGSETLSQHALTVEFTSNPAWYAVQALPYLMEYPYACAEQTFNRFYANALATRIVNSTPRIRAIFGKWKTSDTAALLSNLEKNQELKSILLEETPWVLEAKSESQQKRNIAILFDMVRMSGELESAINTLKEMQSADGGFPWFKGGPNDRYITQYILTGIGRLEKIGAMPDGFIEKTKPMVDAAIHYADQEIKRNYEQLKKQIKQGITQPGPDRLVTQYLYMRSFFSGYGIPGDAFGAVNAYRKQLQRTWLQQNKYMQGMTALALFRTGDIQTAKDIMASLRQNAIRDEEQGMYWKDMSDSYYWFAAPIETQALLIEAFREISPDAAVDRDLKTWLLKQKQTRSWPTTKATADACYALIIGGVNWLSEDRKVTIKLGEKTISSSDDAGAKTGGLAVTEEGTGYFKKVFDGAFVDPSMGNINVTMAGSAAGGPTTRGTDAGGAAAGSPAWGAVYWQYFENLDRIVPPAGDKAALRLSKQLFIEKNTEKGPVLEPVGANGTLKQGDKIIVRIELHSDRDLEYVHMKDMRASCMEPVNVMSGYKWQDGLGYYESTKDASTDFFFSRLPRGSYVFEYPVFVGQIGNFSNGVTSIECMYAPEFGFHSEGIRVNVEN